MGAAGKLEGHPSLRVPSQVTAAAGVEGSPNSSRDVSEDSMELWEAGMGVGGGLGALREVCVLSRPREGCVCSQ